MGKGLHSHYIRLNTTPNNTFRKTSLQTSLQIHPKQKANRKMTSLRSGVKLTPMRKYKETSEWITAPVCIGLLILVGFIFHHFNLWEKLSIFALPFCEDASVGVCKIGLVRGTRMIIPLIIFLGCYAALALPALYFIMGKKQNK